MLPTPYGWVDRHLRAFRWQRVNLMFLTGLVVVVFAVWIRMAYQGSWGVVLALIIMPANVVLLIRAWRSHLHWGRMLDQIVARRTEWEREHG